MIGAALAANCNDWPLQTIECAQPKHLQLVTVDCPLQSWSDERVRNLFGELVALKLLGFGANYSANVLPVDTTDFIGRHYLSCLDTDHGLQVVAGFRALDLERCRLFNLLFPAESLARAANAPLHAEAVTEFVEQDDAVSYIGSWTIHPAVQRNPLLRAALRDHFALGSILFHREVGLRRLILGATLRFKVDRLLSSVGYRPLSLGGKPLSPITVQHLHGESVRLMYFDGCGDDVLNRAKALRRLWDARVGY